MLTNLAAGIERVMRAPSRENLARAARAMLLQAGKLGKRLSDLRCGGYFTGPGFPRIGRSYLSPIPKEALAPSAAKFFALSANYLEHRFDLLGSGWVQVRHGMRCAGLEGCLYQSGDPVKPDRAGEWLKGRLTEPNLPQARMIWSMVDSGYLPIDWQLDFKSGYRWSEAAWYLDIPYGHVPGADIKAPWELARMQHLAHLAWAYALSAQAIEGGAAPEIYPREFRNEVLDFIASNPPRFGVNWRCTMDVAIRAANWLVAYDLFKAYGARFDDEFEDCLARSIYEHALHIADNLEGSPGNRGNHYLAGIAGLLFAAAYLAPCAQTDRWVEFAARELAAEIEAQFTSDGANAEASTSYHRLSAETVTYAAALLGRAASEMRPGAVPMRLLPRHFELIEKMAEFAIDAAKPNGAAIQIGDNDGGRFLKLDPSRYAINPQEARGRFANLAGVGAVSPGSPYWCEDHLDHRHLVSAVNGLFGRLDFARFARDCRIDGEVVRTLAGEAPHSSYLRPEQAPAAAAVRIGDESLSRSAPFLSKCLPLRGSWEVRA